MPRLPEEDEGSRDEGIISDNSFILSQLSLNSSLAADVGPAPHPLFAPLPALPDRGADEEEAHHHQPGPQVVPHIPHLCHQLGQHCHQPGNPHHVEPSAQLDNPQREQLCVKSAATCLRLPKTSRRDTATNSQPGQGRHVAHFYLVYNKLYFLTKFFTL